MPTNIPTMSHRLKILNKAEELTHEKLTGVCDEFGARVFVKIRVADILPINNSGISNAHYAFILRRARGYKFLGCD